MHRRADEMLTAIVSKLVSANFKKKKNMCSESVSVGWLVVLGLTAL